MRRLLSGGCLVLLAACTSAPMVTEPTPVPAPTSAVGATLLAPAAETRRMVLAPNRRFLHPNLESEGALPVYPENVLARRLPPVTVRVDVVIDAVGQVTAVAQRQDGDCAAAASDDTATFLDAVRIAVAGWRYAPALLCEAPAGYAGDDACAAEGMVETPTAVRLSYAFRFSQTAGRPEVERMGAP